MTDFLESVLSKIALFQKKHAFVIFISVLVLTLFLSIGFSKLSIEPDIDKGMPQDLPIYKIQKKITDKFGGQDNVLIIVKLDEDFNAKENCPWHEHRGRGRSRARAGHAAVFRAGDRSGSA